MDKKTKSITITQYDYLVRDFNDEEVDIHGHLHHHSEFDPEGRPLKETRYNRMGEFEEMIEYGYDTTGNLQREAYYTVEDEIAEEKTYFWNESGKIDHVLKTYLDGSVDTIQYEYDHDGQLIKRTTITDEGEVEQTELFNWQNGELTGHEVLDESGDPVIDPSENLPKQTTLRTIHNEKGQVVTEEEVDDAGDIIMTIHRTYLEDGLPDEVDVNIDGKGLTVSRHYFLKYEYTFFE